MSNSDKSLTYADAGVDIDKASDFVRAIKKIAAKTPRTGVMGEIGGFGGMYSLNTGGMENPVLVSSTDGVGTKLKIAFMMEKHDTVGIDLVAMCVNDVAVQGARPLFFLDYLSMGELRSKVAEQIIEGIAEGCREAQCALIAGETAEMPGFYNKNEYDLAGFSVGIVDNDKIVDGSEIRVGHKLVGISSSGLHSNGYSLVRKICFDILNLNVTDYIEELGRPLGEALLEPTRIYTDIIRRLCKDLPVHGLAHITGGGIVENVIRIVPAACGVEIFHGSWEVPPIFTYLQKAGNVADEEMWRTFNNGIGLIAIVPEDAAQDVVERVAGMNEKAYIIGRIVRQPKNSASRIQWVKHNEEC
ncbi:MAG: phosphoribosylformylglycinamidine cyclo-ligase [Desulfobacterales bacterium]|nr:phosphoribosylformylglycinamidine cyclo-ligase [Desulfobacterales bacterium]